MRYRYALAALVVALSIAGCAPKTERTTKPEVQPRSAFEASIESSFTAQRARLESAVSLALDRASSDTTPSYVELPPGLRELGIDGYAEVLPTGDGRYVLLLDEYNSFRTWDGWLYSESGSPPPPRLVKGGVFRGSAPVSAHWWWVRINRSVQVDMSGKYAPPSNMRVQQKAEDVD